MAQAHSAARSSRAYMVNRESESRPTANGSSVKWLIPTLLSMLIGLVGVVYANIKSDVGKVAVTVESQARTLTDHEAQLREIKAVNALILQRLGSIDGKLDDHMRQATALRDQVGALSRRQ